MKQLSPFKNDGEVLVEQALKAIARPRATEAVGRALQVDETLAEAHASAVLVAFWYDWDWSRAQLEFERTIALNPNYASAHQWYCWYLCAMREFDRGADELNLVSIPVGLPPVDEIAGNAAPRTLLGLSLRKTYGSSPPRLHIRVHRILM